ncbi:MAG: signal recognition particle-docking protein FtsY, partial [Paenibacillaceae bacterium]|nr:signal recognition particle-docking protein FtsY [Paenibacillaceae bacterium]
KWVGLGEKIDDLQPFDPEQFVHALFSDWIAGEEQDSLQRSEP